MEPAGVETLLGIAMGCIGMSMDDFGRCTPSEFYEVYGAWIDHQQARERTRWEMVRTECLCTLQPYSPKKLSPEDVMEFEWDKEKNAATATNRPQLTHEEEMARYREMKRKYGLK